MAKFTQEQRDQNDGFVLWLEENYTGKWNNCHQTVDSIVWKDEMTDAKPTQADFEAVKDSYVTKAIEKREKSVNLKASAKAKLIAGEPLTEEEADRIVL
tara:strand:+ start:89 stop:385 length:297 start_codon:yes stop_codon:yes gene_type:complete